MAKTPTSTVSSAPENAAKKKRKKKAAGNKASRPDNDGGKGTKQPPTKIAVKPSRAVSAQSLASQSTASVPVASVVNGQQTEKSVDGGEDQSQGYSTGFYGILLETKRVENMCRSMSLQTRHVAKLRKIFDNEDDYRTGEVTVDEFFHAIHEEKRTLTSGIFQHVGLSSNIKRLNFDQFVLCIVTFASTSRLELLHYAFTLFDKDESGIMDMRELKEFCGGLKNKGFYFQKNVDVAQKKLTERDHRGPGAHHHAVGAGSDGLVDFEDITEGSAHFSAAFYPIQQFQRNIQHAALGEAFWDKVIDKKTLVERIVHYMRLHDGHLPPLTAREQLKAWGLYALHLLTGGFFFQGAAYALRKAAVNKYAEEMHQRTAAIRQEEKTRPTELEGTTS